MCNRLFTHVSSTVCPYDFLPQAGQKETLAALAYNLSLLTEFTAALALQVADLQQLLSHSCTHPSDSSDLALVHQQQPWHYR